MLKLYGVPISVHTRKAIYALRAKQIAYALIPVAPVIPATVPADWAELTPTGKIPVLVDNGLTLSDSSAICAYLERLHPQAPLYPADAAGHARALCLERYASDVVFRDLVHPLFREVFVQPKVNQVPSDPAVIKQALEAAAPRIFGFLETALVSDYLVGDSAGMADVAVASNLITYQYLGFALDRARYRRVAAWFDRVLATPTMRDTLRGEREAVASMGLDGRVLDAVLN